MSIGRLYDYMADTATQHFSEHNPVFNDATVYEISNVADMCALRKTTLPSTSFPLVAPPFKNCWFEYDMSRFFGGHVDSAMHRQFATAKSGFLLATEDFSMGTPEERQETAIGILQEIRAIISDEIRESLAKVPWALVRWFGTMTWWCADPTTDNWLARGETLMVFIKATGGLINPAIYMPSARTMKRGEVNLVGHLLEQAAEPVWEALSLLNCKNIVQDVQLPSQTRAQRRRGERPGVKYRVIKVVPFATYRRYLRTGEKVPDTMVPYHLIPGKLCDYREKGLFGRYKGLFYRPPHARGSLRHGATVKDYDVQKPKVEYPNA